MAYIEGHSRDQMLLLPASVDDYVAADNPVRFIAAFVEDLDLGAAGFVRARPEATGRPGYDPGDLLKLYLYGYLNRVRSSRRLAAETARNLEVLWLLRGLQPDFRTIADFRRDNRGAFKAVFRSFVLLCRQLDLFGRELLAVDGTRLKAVNSRRRNFTRNKLAEWIKHADERIDEYLSHLDRVDQSESEGFVTRAATLEAKIASLRERRAGHAAMLAELEASGESQISLTDPDARGMATHPKVGVGYNAQVAVDAKHKLIVEQHVTNAGSDLGLLAQTAGAAKELLGVEQIDAVADMGYYKGEDIEACEAAGITPYVARPQRGAAVFEGRFAKHEFVTMRETISTAARRGIVSIRSGDQKETGIARSITATGGPAATARSNPNVPVQAFGTSRGGRERRSSIAWQSGLLPDPASSICGAKPSSIRSARSNSG